MGTLPKKAKVWTWPPTQAFRCRRRIRPDITGIAASGRSMTKKCAFCSTPSMMAAASAEVGLGMSGRMRQRHDTSRDRAGIRAPACSPSRSCSRR